MRYKPCAPRIATIRYSIKYHILFPQKCETQKVQSLCRLWHLIASREPRQDSLYVPWNAQINPFLCCCHKLRKCNTARERMQPKETPPRLKSEQDYLFYLLLSTNYALLYFTSYVIVTFEIILSSPTGISGVTEASPPRPYASAIMVLPYIG